MQYLVQMKLVPQARPVTTEKGGAFIEQHIFPTLERCKKLEDKKEILAGGRDLAATPPPHMTLASLPLTHWPLSILPSSVHHSTPVAPRQM